MTEAGCKFMGVSNFYIDG
jgi:hypothetical protein